jgi:hypothetical protein
VVALRGAFSVQSVKTKGSHRHPRLTGNPVFIDIFDRVQPSVTAKCVIQDRRIRPLRYPSAAINCVWLERVYSTYLLRYQINPPLSGSGSGPRHDERLPDWLGIRFKAGKT